MSRTSERVTKVVETVMETQVKKKKKKKRKEPDVIKGVNVELRGKKAKSKRVKRGDGSNGSSGKSSALNSTVIRNNARGRLKQRLRNKTSDGDVSLVQHDTERSVIGYSRIGQGKEMFPGMDGRSLIAKRLRELYGDMCSDLGGEEHMSTLEKALSKQVSSLITIGEDMVAGRAIEDPEYDYLEHLACVKTINQVGRTLGIKRRMRPVKETTLKDFIEAEVET